MLSFYLIWSLSYFTLLWWISRFWPENKVCTYNSQFCPKVTLIIPFRNEAENITRLSVNLKNLRYPDLEILLIDDHSEDGSFQLLEKRLGENQNIQIIKSPLKGKKGALEYGVNLAGGEIIICSDADCDFPEFWAEQMITPFQNSNIQLVAGPVMVEVKGKFLEFFQSLDWASILLMTNYSFAKKKPLMCSAANFAYRKSAFERVHGYEGNNEFASGDDEFLLKKIHKLYGEDACSYLTSSDVLVKTSAEPSWQALINQRVRWASKWKAHRTISHTLSAVGAFLIQFVWIGSFYLVSLGTQGIIAFGFVWLMKIAAEKVSLGKVLKSLEIEQTYVTILQTSFLHPFYVLRVGIAALRGKFSWKGRES